MQSLLSKHWHHLPSPEVLALLDTNEEKGVDQFEVDHRLQKFGHNILTPKKGKGPFERFIVQFNQPLVYILLVAGLVTAFLHEWVDSGVILGVVLVNAFIGYIQESKALAAIEALAKTMKSDATVLRGGEKKRISSTELVPGDIIFLQSGDKVPADLRLLRVRELQIDESALTGESVPVQKTMDILEPKTMLADRKNMAYSSSLVTYGTGTGVVIATGDQTEIGRISELIASADVLATPLTKKIAHFSGILLYIILGLAGLTFLVGLYHGQSWVDMFMASVALAVGAIPEGLPAAMTITLAIGVGRMAKRHAIIRKLPAVETLGSTTVICSDKTGTLTQNQMTVQEVIAANNQYSVKGIGYAPDGSFEKGTSSVADPLSDRALQECLLAGLLCNDSRLIKGGDKWKIEGDPTEGALITSALKAGFSYESVHKDFPRVDSVPFESQHQYMATLHRQKEGQSNLVFVKGSVESILSKCEKATDNEGTSIGLDMEKVRVGVEEMASKGLRVLAFAKGEMPKDATSVQHRDVTKGLVFLGLQGMIDPPRNEAIKAVEACKGAGVLVKMITGDHAGTASAIAKKLGLDQQNGIDPNQIAMTGKTISDLSDAQLTEQSRKTVVFARVAPEQKLRLVEAHQTHEHVVAMTGDGVNDAPALRQANIGVAMGITGTEVAKEAADMVLTDDNFASIEAAVEEGRGVFDNLIKFITWTLPTNLAEGLVILVAVFLGVTLPILPVQILWVNMTTAVLLGLMLAFEPRELGIMKRRPRDPKSPILTRPLICRIFLVSAVLVTGAFLLFKWQLSEGVSEEKARTVAVNILVFGELFYLFNCRSLTRTAFALGFWSNKWLIWGVLGMALLQILYTYNPLMNTLFHSAPIGLPSWTGIIGVGLTVYFVVGFEKWVRRKVQAWS
ncbi:carbonate dehydratase [bacterium F11]|nr:carbonate dehydratase [bacterium F11]